MHATFDSLLTIPAKQPNVDVGELCRACQLGGEPGRIGKAAPDCSRPSCAAIEAAVKGLQANVWHGMQCKTRGTEASRCSHQAHDVQDHGGSSSAVLQAVAHCNRPKSLDRRGCTACTHTQVNKNSQLGPSQAGLGTLPGAPYACVLVCGGHRSASKTCDMRRSHCCLQPQLSVS